MEDGWLLHVDCLTKAQNMINGNNYGFNLTE
jgi:hypothetical protein